MPIAQKTPTNVAASVPANEVTRLASAVTDPALPPTQAPRVAFKDIDDYKTLIAHRIVDANPTHTFRGALPPMLPAIVVVTIQVDKAGKLLRVAVLRSRDREASAVALAAVKSSAPFAAPLNLIPAKKQSLTFAETFLFNGAQRFQLRTLAGPQ